MIIPGWSPLGARQCLMGWLLAFTVMMLGLVEIRASYQDIEASTAYACENGKLILECQHGEVIRIIRANYGRFTISVCNRHGQTEGWNLQCMSQKSQSIIAERCDGRRECQMHVNNHVFGDPCPSTSKYAEVRYICEMAPSENPHSQQTTTTVTPIHPQISMNASPRPPQITSATALSPNEVEIEWTQEEHGSPILTTVVYFTDQGMEIGPSSIFTSSEKSLVIEQLRPNTTYEIFMKSFNIHGPSVSSNTVRVTTPPLDESQLTTTTPKPETEGPGVPDFDPNTRRPSTRRPTQGPQIPHGSTTTTSTTTTTPKPGGIKPDNVDPSSKTEHPNNGNGDDEFPGGVVDKFCEEKLYRGVVWPQTRYGRKAEERCPENLRGVATWRCLGYGWEKSGPDLSDCVSAWLESLDEQINSVMSGEEPADKAAVDLSRAMKGQELTSGDLKRAATKLLPKLTQGLYRDDPLASRPTKKLRMKKFKKAIMESGSRLLSKNNFKSWRSLSRQDRRRAATSLVLSVEETGFRSASLMEPGESDVSVDENIVMQVDVIDTQKTHTDVTFPSKRDLSKTLWEAETDSITITSTSLKVAGRNGPVNIVFTLYKNMEDLIQPQVNTITSVPTEPTPDDMDGHYNAGTIRDTSTVSVFDNGAVMVINTKVIAASIGSTKKRNPLPEPVRFTLHHLEPTNEAVPVCSFWDMDTSYMSGRWSQDGCKLLDTNSTHTTCECNHLTNFAVLMDVSGVKLSESNELALRVITFVGCVISIICLILSWITFMVFKNLQCDRNTIHKNLVISLLLAEIVFLSGIAQTEPKVLCSIIAGVLHYLFLAAFAWMCLEGVQLYVMLVEVFEQEKSRVHWYYLFGYGAPAIVVAISAGVYHQGYGTDRHCWLTSENHFIWAFVGPALAVMAINIVMLGIAIYTMCRHSNMSATMRERSKVTKFRAWVKGAIVLVVLLGLTWLLGVLYLNQESVVMAYFFTVLNSLQGLFIFVFHCLRNEKVQKEYRKVARRTSWLPNCIRVNYGGYSGVASSSPVGSSGSGNYLSKLFGQRKRKRSATSTNSSAKPFLHRDQHRRSDTENSTSKDSSQVPSSLNGYVYNPGYNNVANVKTPFLQSNGNGAVITADNGHSGLTPTYETVEGLAGDLSEYVDCSVVDSEYVSEYCKHNMQVSKEERRYSTGSEDSDIVKPVNTRNNLEVDNLSTLSLASSSRKVASDVDSVDMLDGDLEEKLGRENQDPRLNLQQYIIPTHKKSYNNNNLNVKNVNENMTNKHKGADNKCSSMNKLSNKPVHSLSSIPEAETSPQHSSTPNIQFKLGFSEPTPSSSAANSPESNASAQDIPVPIYEEVKLDIESPESGKTSLPNLNMDGLTIDCGGSDEQGSLKRRHSSENDVQFSPFRFSQTEC